MELFKSLETRTKLFKDKAKINPINFYYGNLTAKEYDELLKQASVVNQSLD